MDLKKQKIHSAETRNDQYKNDMKVVLCCIGRLENRYIKEYVDFIRNVLDEYIKYVGIDIEKRIENNKEKYLKKFSPNNEVWYQYRIGGYLAERLTNVFLLKGFKKIKTYKMVITEQKYE